MTQTLVFIIAATVLSGPLARPALGSTGAAPGHLARAGAGTERARPDRAAIEQAREAERRTSRGLTAKQEATDARTFKVGRDAVLSLSNVAGDITVTVAAGDEVRVQAVRRAYGRNDEDARQQLEATEVEMEQRGNRIDVRTVHERSSRHAEVEFSVSAPATLSIEIRSVSGDVAVSDLKGDARLETVSGDVTARQLTALASAKTVSGTVDITGCADDNEVEAASVSGDVIARGIKSRTCTVGSVSGDITLEAASCERAVIGTVSGDVDYAGALSRSGRYEFKSHSGDVTIAVDGQTGFEVSARTFSGSLRSDLPLKLESGGETDRERGHGSRAMRGLFGDGSANLSITTFSGDVSIRKK